jgi:hypothetical protein
MHAPFSNEISIYQYPCIVILYIKSTLCLELVVPAQFVEGRFQKRDLRPLFKQIYADCDSV